MASIVARGSFAASCLGAPAAASCRSKPRVSTSELFELVRLIDPSTADLKSRTTSREFDQGLQIDEAVLESISLRVPMTFRSS